MARALNTSHELYGNLVALIGVEDDGTTIKDFVGGQTITPHANVTTGSGTYGAHFTTFLVANNAQGLALSPGFPTKGNGGSGCTFVVINAGNIRGSRGTVFNLNAMVSPACYTSDFEHAQALTANPTTAGTTALIGTGAHSFGLAVNGNTAHKIFADGAISKTGGQLGNTGTDTNKAVYIGGHETSGFGGFAADYVWIAQFNVYPSDAQIAALHASLGAGNAFALIDSGGGGGGIAAKFTSHLSRLMGA